MNRVTVKIWETTHKKLSDFSEAKETSIAEVIDKAVTRYAGHISDKAEIQQLKAEIERLHNVGASQPAVPAATLSSAGARCDKSEEQSTAEDAPAPHSPQRTKEEEKLRSGDDNEKPSLPLAIPWRDAWNQYRKDHWNQGQQDEYEYKLSRIKEMMQEKEDHLRRLEAIKTEAVRAREEYKSEGARARHYGDARAEPVKDDLASPFNCPDGHSPNHCYNSLCLKHGECLRQGNIQPLAKRDNGNPVWQYTS